ncbi:MAG: hypothetical protein AAGA48_33585 [Myxococcota bacterium]
MSVMRVSVACLALLGACGGGDGGGNNDPTLCDNFRPCGGDPTGSWSLVGFCNGADALSFDECPGATFDLTSSRTGSFELNADQSYESEIASDTSTTLFAPAECLTGIDDCSDIEQPDESLTCSGDPASSCTCTGEVSDVSMATGSWAVTGNAITITDDAGTNTLEFCIEGDTMTLRDDEGAVTRLTR